MTAKRSGPFVAIAAAMCLLPAFPLSAQGFSPYLETTGRGAYDQYRDAVWCGAVLEREIEAAPDAGRRPHLEQGADYTRNFALLMLESGDVIDPAGTILAPDDLPVARQKALAGWQAVLDTRGNNGESVEAEIARCLSLYGHDWE